MSTIDKLLKVSLRRWEQILFPRNKLEVCIYGYILCIQSLHSFLSGFFRMILDGCRIYRKTLHERERDKSDAERKRVRVRSRQQRVTILVFIFTAF